MSDNKKTTDIKADRQMPTSTPTPLKQQEATASIWQQGGAKTPEAALATDKNSVRKCVGS